MYGLCNISSSRLSKQPFLSHSLPQKILPDLSWITPAGFNFFAFRNNSFFYGARSSALRRTPNLEDQVSVFTSPSDRVAQLYPQAPDSLLVAFYDS
jgi:hypothetical protein